MRANGGICKTFSTPLPHHFQSIISPWGGIFLDKDFGRDTTVIIVLRDHNIPKQRQFPFLHLIKLFSDPSSSANELLRCYYMSH